MDILKKRTLFFFRQILLPACGIFSLITLIFFIISDLSGASDTVTVHFHFKRVISFFAFSFVLALLNLVFRTAMSAIAKFAIHFFASGLVFVLLLIADGYISNAGSTYFLLAIGAYLLVYVFAAFIVYIVRKLFSSDREKSAGDYRRQFKQ